MRLTQHTDYSLRVLLYLALVPEQLATIQQISEAYGISRNHLMKVVHKLVKTGFVESVRGQGGGIRLNKAPQDIGIGKVIRAMEPDIALVECLRPDNTCVITPACKLPPILNKALAAFFRELDRYTLKDLLPASARNELATLLNIRN
ncbi:MAG: Rrf2 family transcriptional regulator [Pseudomonadales bacterium]